MFRSWKGDSLYNIILSFWYVKSPAWKEQSSSDKLQRSAAEPWECSLMLIPSIETPQSVY